MPYTDPGTRNHTVHSVRWLCSLFPAGSRSRKFETHIQCSGSCKENRRAHQRGPTAQCTQSVSWIHLNNLGQMVEIIESLEHSQINQLCGFLMMKSAIKDWGVYPFIVCTTMFCGLYKFALHDQQVQFALSYWSAGFLNSLWNSNNKWWHESGSTLAQVMAWCCQAPSHHLNQCWLLISEVLWHSLWKFTESAQNIILYNSFENYAPKITATSPRGPWVNRSHMFCWWTTLWCQRILLTAG